MQMTENFLKFQISNFNFQFSGALLKSVNDTVQYSYRCFSLFPEANAEIVISGMYTNVYLKVLT